MSLIALRWYLEQGLPDEEIAIKLGITIERVRRLRRGLSAPGNLAGSAAEA